MAEGYPNLPKKPFERANLEPNKRDIVSVSLNEEERLLIDRFRYIWQCENDSTTLKALARIGAKVIHSYFDEETLRWLASPRRVRGSVAEPKTEQNVIQKEPLM